MTEELLSPLRQQYKDAKDKQPARLVFFRIGDYYEATEEDAQTVADLLDIALATRAVARGRRVPIAQIPVDAAQNYFDKLIAKGAYIVVYEYIGEGYEGKSYGESAD